MASILNQNSFSPSSKAALLAKESSLSSSKPPKTKLVFISLILSTCIALSAAATFAFLLFVSPKTPNHPTIKEVSRSLTKLKHPVVLLISLDGFRFGYQYKTELPNINKLITNGTEAELGLIPVFPTLTYPNHYSIVTGLYPAYHGIINNDFKDPITGEIFDTENIDSKWWLGEPLWETVTNKGLKASTYFWPGSEVKKGSWKCPKEFCPTYKNREPFEIRVDTILNYFDLDSDDIPSFMTLYFEDPDSQGHRFGPDDPKVTEALSRVDGMIGRLVEGLKKRGVFEDVNLIILGDHGMVSNCVGKAIILDDLTKFIPIPNEWFQIRSPALGIIPPNTFPKEKVKELVRKINEVLKSGKIENGEYLTVYLKEDLPSRLVYSQSTRIPPIVGIIAEGYKVEQSRPIRFQCGGSHGYDNKYFSMRSIFIGHGPNFGKGKKVPSFMNVEVYNLVLSILNIKGAPNNGTDSFPQSVLLANP